MKLNSLITASVLSALALATSAHAGTVFSESFEGNNATDLAAKTFSSGATTGFNYWPLGSKSMDAGYFSVVNKASDVHTEFVDHLDADDNADGHYAIFNGFSDMTGKAYEISLSGLTEGSIYTFSASFLSLAPNPPYPQISDLQFRKDGADLGGIYTVIPVPKNTEQWVNVSRNFVATAGVNTLAIFNLAGDSNAGNDFGIDNVTVSTVDRGPSAVPLPASSFMGLGAILLGAARRRR